MVATIAATLASLTERLKEGGHRTKVMERELADGDFFDERLRYAEEGQRIHHSIRPVRADIDVHLYGANYTGDTNYTNLTNSGHGFNSCNSCLKKHKCRRHPKIRA